MEILNIYKNELAISSSMDVQYMGLWYQVDGNLHVFISNEYLTSAYMCQSHCPEYMANHTHNYKNHHHILSTHCVLPLKS